MAEHQITTYEVGVLLGYQGDRGRVISSARVWLSRRGIVAEGREAGREGQNLYPRARVEAAIEQAPGKGAPGQPRTNRRKQSDSEGRESK